MLSAEIQAASLVSRVVNPVGELSVSFELKLKEANRDTNQVEPFQKSSFLDLVNPRQLLPRILQSTLDLLVSIRLVDPQTQFHLLFLPSTMPNFHASVELGVKTDGLTQSTIANDFTPLILAGLRLQTVIRVRPITNTRISQQFRM